MIFPHTRFNIRCSLVKHGFENDSVNSDILYSASWTGAPFSLEYVSPPRPIYIPINVTNIKSIRVYLTFDNSDTLVDLNGEKISYFIMIKKLSKDL